MPGMHGTVAAVAALQKADLIVALGARFDDRVTGKLSSFAPNAAVVHADIDPAEIGKNRAVDVPIVGDLREVIADLLPELEREHGQHGKPDLEGWWRQIDDWRETFPLGYDEPADGHLAPQHVIQRIGEISGPDADLRGRRRAAPDVGRPVHPLRAAEHLAELRRPRDHGLLGARRRWARRSAHPTGPCGPSTATAASR